ncbi:HD domain-containing phosphohydrolase [Nitrospirota bacterium]
MELRGKIITIIAAILLVSIGVSTAVVLNIQKSWISNSKSEDVAAVGQIIIGVIEHNMIDGQHDKGVADAFSTLKQSPQVLRLRLLSPEGIISHSLDMDEEGFTSETFKSTTDISTPVINQNTLSTFIRIENREECFGCHLESVPAIGILEIEYDISRNRADILSLGRLLTISSIFTILVIGVILSLFLSKYVTTPMASFLRTVKKVENGDLEARVKARGLDEFSVMGQAFNKMLDEVRYLYDKNLSKEKEVARVKVELDHKVVLEELNSQLQHKVKEVESANLAVLSLSKEVKLKNIELEKMVDRLQRINEIGRVLSSIIDTEELLKIIVKTSVETIKARKGTVHVSRKNKDALSIAYQLNMGFIHETGQNPELSPHFQEMMLEGRQLLSNENTMKGEDGQTSFLGVPMRMRGQIIGGILLESKEDGSGFSHDELELLDTVSNQAVVALENAWLYETVKTNYFGTIQSLVNALEASDRYTKGHSERVRLLGLELCRYMGVDHRELEVFEHAAILHDIGKIGIDTSVLNKEGELTTSEFSLIRAHPIIGDEILGPIGTLQGVRTTILQHHERYDGKGYPYGISGEEITLKARILAVIDTFDAMLTDRPYRRALEVESAVNEIRKGSGTQFDPQCVNAFLEMVKERESLFEEAGYRMF